MPLRDAASLHGARQRRQSVHDLQLKLRGIEYVRVQWVDLSNIVRFQVVPVPESLRLCEDEQPDIHLTARTLGYVNVDFAKGFDDTSECLYIFDLDSLRPCMYAPRHAVVMGWFQRQMPSPRGKPRCRGMPKETAAECHLVSM